MSKLYILLAVLFYTLCTSCKMNKERLDEYDMSEFCNHYHVIKPPKNSTMYVFIEKNKRDNRFFIWKDYNYQNTGYGFTYSYVLDYAGAIKNGVYNSAEEAVKEAKSNLPKDGMVLFLYNLAPFGDGQWIVNGNILNELCEGQERPITNSVKENNQDINQQRQDNNSNQIGATGKLYYYEAEKSQEKAISNVFDENTSHSFTNKIVKSDTTYILSKKDANSRTKSYLIKDDEIILQNIDGDYGEVKYYDDNNSNKRQGWVLMSDLK